MLQCQDVSIYIDSGGGILSERFFFADRVLTRGVCKNLSILAADNPSRFTNVKAKSCQGIFLIRLDV